MKNNCLLKGAKEVMERFDLNVAQFYMFLQLGMPMRKINGRWYGHEQNIEEFLKLITNPYLGKDGGKDIDVSNEVLSDEVQKSLMEK